MSTSIYKINKGINKSIEFKGLRAQYIWYLGAGILFLMAIFAILYIIGFNQYLCIVIIGIAGTWMFIKIYAMSHKYGEYGLMKEMAKRAIPKVIKCNSRSIFCKKV
ncbi:MAG TPA: DUF4133 domain-containing protein [Pseudosphingobacterium sp.]|nr:DUF4133 domain-containing protein [Pseudosphingobacterium sp.]